MSDESQPIFSSPAERQVLGAAMKDIEARACVRSALVPEDFYEPKHRHLYEILCSLDDRKIPIDLVSITEELNRLEFGEIISAYEAADIAQGCATTTNAEYHAGIIREKATARFLVRKCQEAIAQVEKDSNDIEEKIDRFLQEVKANQSPVIHGPKRLGDHFAEVLDGIQERNQLLANRSGVVRGLSTGFFELDRCLDGLCPGRQYVLASRPAVGKTSLMLQICGHAVEEKPVLIFSMEMSFEEMAERFASNRYRINLQEPFSSDQAARLVRAGNKIMGLPLFIDDTCPSLPQIENRARRIALENPLGLIAIDYLQLINGERKGNTNRYEVVSEISRRCKLLAKELKVPVLLLSQLNRLNEQQNREPRLSDLRDSGSIEQDADAVIFLHREAPANESEAFKSSGPIKALIRKNRFGPCHDVELHFVGEHTRFESMAELERAF